MLGALIGAGASIIGGLIGKSEAKKNRELQLAAAKNGIQWRVKDALKAGVHPLYAVGAPGVNIAPTEVSGLGPALADAGQDVGRAVDAMSDRGERLDGYTKALRALQLSRGQLENELLRSQIAQLRQAAHPPAPVIAGRVVKDQSRVPSDMRVVPPERTPAAHAGIMWETNPYWMDAQSWENIYGDSELSSTGYGVSKGVADYYWNVYSPYNPRSTLTRFRKAYRPKYGVPGLRSWK